MVMIVDLQSDLIGHCMIIFMSQKPGLFANK